MSGQAKTYSDDDGRRRPSGGGGDGRNEGGGSRGDGGTLPLSLRFCLLCNIITRVIEYWRNSFTPFMEEHEHQEHTIIDESVLTVLDWNLESCVRFYTLLEMGKKHSTFLVLSDLIAIPLHNVLSMFFRLFYVKNRLLLLPRTATTGTISYYTKMMYNLVRITIVEATFLYGLIFFYGPNRLVMFEKVVGNFSTMHTLLKYIHLQLMPNDLLKSDILNFIPDNIKGMLEMFTSLLARFDQHEILMGLFRSTNPTEGHFRSVTPDNQAIKECMEKVKEFDKIEVSATHEEIEKLMVLFHIMPIPIDIPSIRDDIKKFGSSIRRIVHRNMSLYTALQETSRHVATRETAIDISTSAAVTSVFPDILEDIFVEVLESQKLLKRIYQDRIKNAYKALGRLKRTPHCAQIRELVIAIGSHYFDDLVDELDPSIRNEVCPHLFTLSQHYFHSDMSSYVQQAIMFLENFFNPNTAVSDDAVSDDVDADDADADDAGADDEDADDVGLAEVECASDNDRVLLTDEELAERFAHSLANNNHEYCPEDGNGLYF